MTSSLPKVGGSNSNAGDPVSPCVKGFEVEFLDCESEAEVKQSLTIIRNIPDDESLHTNHDAMRIILKGKKQHFVNLRPKDKYRGQESSSSRDPTEEEPVFVDRMGQKPRIVVRFKDKGTHEVQVEIFHAGSTDLSYTENEIGRNENFKENLTHIGKTDSHGVLIIEDLKISPAGGNVYKVRAEDLKTKATARSKGSIVAWRYFWIQKVAFGNRPAGNHIIGRREKHHYEALSHICRKYAMYYIYFNMNELKKISSPQYEVLDIKSRLSIIKDLEEQLTKSESVQNKSPFVCVVNSTRAIGSPANGFEIETSIQRVDLDQDQDAYAFAFLPELGFTNAPYVYSEFSRPYVVGYAAYFPDNSGFWGKSEIDIRDCCEILYGKDTYYMGKGVRANLAKVKRKIGSASRKGTVKFTVRFLNTGTQAFTSRKQGISFSPKMRLL
jgi:hypothetical protein